jgi:subtilisin-like proprotein convertase family protein
MSFRPLIPTSVVIAGLSLLALPARAQTFSNPDPITINQAGVATPYPSTIAVAGVAELVGQLTVTITGLSHTFPNDVDVMLAGPEGQSIVLMSDVGGNFDLEDVTLVFDDAAAESLSAGQITSGTYLPTNADSITDAFPAPAPIVPSDTSLAGFAGTDPNGVWSLFVLDDGVGESGSIAGGWSITVPEPASAGHAALLALAALAVRRRTRARR